MAGCAHTRPNVRLYRVSEVANGVFEPHGNSKTSKQVLSLSISKYDNNCGKKIMNKIFDELINRISNEIE